VSHDPSEITLIWWSDDQETFIIIHISYFCGNQYFLWYFKYFFILFLRILWSTAYIWNGMFCTIINGTFEQFNASLMNKSWICSKRLNIFNSCMYFFHKQEGHHCTSTTICDWIKQHLNCSSSCTLKTALWNWSSRKHSILLSWSWMSSRGCGFSPLISKYFTFPYLWYMLLIWLMLNCPMEKICAECNRTAHKQPR